MEITSVPEILFEETTMEFLSALSERIRELPRMLSERKCILSILAQAFQP